jgi:acyl carrier protein
MNSAYVEFHAAIAKLLEVSADQLTLDARLDQFETWDSLAMISVIALVTEHYGVSISGETVRRALTLSDVLDGVAHARPSAAAMPTARAS